MRGEPTGFMVMRAPFFDPKTKDFRDIEKGYRGKSSFRPIRAYESLPYSIKETYKTEYKRKCADSYTKNKLQIKI